MSTPMSAPMSTPPRSRTPSVCSSAEEEVLYACTCVAAFDLRGLALRYMGHEFLRLEQGEVVDILMEVGRIDELSEFPLDVGCEWALLDVGFKG